MVEPKTVTGQSVKEKRFLERIQAKNLERYQVYDDVDPEPSE